jgi:hypothetical protein
MTTTNQTSHHLTTKEELEQTRDDANKAYLGSQKDAARAAGLIALLWTKTASPNADSVGKAWLAQQVEAKNTMIKAHNKGANNKANHLVPIPVDDAYAQVIRIAFVLDERKQQPQVSRNRTVVEGVITDHPDHALMTADEFAGAIMKEGGFEAYLNQKRGNEGKQPALEAAVRDFLNKELLDRIAIATPKDTVDLGVQDIDDGTVILVGRHKQGQLDVCAVVPVDESTQSALLRPFSHYFAGAPEPSALFIHNAMQLADLVRDGTTTELRAGGMQSGTWLKVEQVATLEGGATGPVMSITVRHADASVIVRVGAKATVKLTAPASPLMLMPEDHRKLRKRHAVLHAVFCNTVTETLTGGMRWSVLNKALENPADATVEASWTDPSGHDHKPLTIRGFDDAISADLSRGDLRQLREQGALEHVKTGNEKSPTRVNVEWGEANMAFSLLKRQSTMKLTAPTAKKGSKSFKLEFVQAAVDKALKAGAKAFTLAVDPVGLLRLSWGDDVANYEVFVPASTSTGGLITSKQEPLV